MLIARHRLKQFVWRFKSSLARRLFYDEMMAGRDRTSPTPCTDRLARHVSELCRNIETAEIVD